MQRLANIPWGTIFQYASIAILAFLGIGGLVFIAAQISGQATILGSVSKVETARGLITFLIVFVTVVIALILVLAAFLSSEPHYKERFALGKEVLTTLIGILGTIVGFYFGSTLETQEGVHALNTSPIVISNEQPKNGEIITIMSLVTGGIPPYSYSMTFNPSNIIEDIETGISTDGVIQQSIPISSPISSNTNIKFEIDIEDSTGNTATIEGKQITVISQ